MKTPPIDTKEAISLYKKNYIQWHALLFRSQTLTHVEKCIAGYFAVVRFNQRTGQLNPSVGRIAEDVATSTRTVQRTLNKLEKEGWFDVAKGGGRSRKNRYVPAKRRLLEAVALREQQEEKDDKVVAFLDRKRRQGCRTTAPNSAVKQRHGCRQNTTTKQNNESGGQASYIDGEVSLWEFIPSGAFEERFWADRLIRLGIERLGRSVPEDFHQNQRGHWLPGRLPASFGSDAWELQSEALMTRISTGERLELRGARLRVWPRNL